MKYFLLLILCFININASLTAQSECYKNLRKEGLTLLQKKNYRSAVDKFFAARYCPDKPAKDDLDDLIKKAQDQWVAALDQANKKTTAALARADSALALANKIINALYFYKDSLALAYKNGYYGFINKKGEIVIDYYYWEALPFDNTGYARVKKNNIAYLIDTKGVEYQLATELNQLNSNILALDLSNKQLDSFPRAILEHPQLKVLLLSDNQLDSLPAAFGNLAALQLLDLSSNRLTSVPVAFGELKNLKFLDLSFNQLTNIPEALGNLTSLEYLSLHVNELKNLPEALGNLNSLRFLYLSNNQLTNLPIGLKNLKQVQFLDLYYNPLHPEAFQNLSPQFYNDQLMQFAQNLYYEEKYSETVPYYRALDVKALNNDQKRAHIFIGESLFNRLVGSKEFKLALDVALMAQKCQDSDMDLFFRLPLAYLLNDQYEKAKAIYMAFKDKKYNDNWFYKELFITDFDNLEADGITHPDIAKIRALLAN